MTVQLLFKTGTAPSSLVTFISISQENADKLLILIDLLEENEDIQKVHCNFNIE